MIIGAEAGRVDESALPDEAFVSAMTLAELHLGVLSADDPEVRRRRLETLAFAERAFTSIPVDDDVARAFAQLTDSARRAGRRPPILDTLIAATAMAEGMPLLTQDADFHAFTEVSVIRV